MKLTASLPQKNGGLKGDEPFHVKRFGLFTGARLVSCRKGNQCNPQEFSRFYPAQLNEPSKKQTCHTSPYPYHPWDDGIFTGP